MGTAAAAAAAATTRVLLLVRAPAAVVSHLVVDVGTAAPAEPTMVSPAPCPGYI